MAKKNGSVNIMQQATNFALAGAASAGIDGLTEVTQFPFLNDAAPIGGNANLSMSELLLYGSGALFFVFGLFALVTKKKIAGIGSDAIGTGAGTVLGTWAWNNYLATMVGVRK